MSENEEIHITLDGQKFQGRFSISGGKRPTITVWYRGFSETTQIGAMPAEALAANMLRELILKHEPAVKP